MIFYSSMSYDYLEEYIPYTWKDVLGKSRLHICNKSTSNVLNICVLLIPLWANDSTTTGHLVYNVGERLVISQVFGQL